MVKSCTGNQSGICERMESNTYAKLILCWTAILLLVPKLLLGNYTLKVQAFIGSREAGASTSRFPSWSLGTRVIIAILLCCFSALTVSASPAMEDEIHHLLNAIATSDCVFVRNNSRYKPDEAVKHIEKKYNYLKKRIKTTEDFIMGAATKSSMSGKPYLMICNGRETPSADWLHSKLTEYRSKK